MEELKSCGAATITVGKTFIIDTPNTYNIGPDWSYPERVDVREYSDRIEFIYKEIKDPHVTYTSTLPISHEQRVFKIVFSCVDGKWNKSGPIYGKIIPAQSIPEWYEFDGEE